MERHLGAHRLGGSRLGAAIEAKNGEPVIARFYLGLTNGLGYGVCLDTTKAESWFRNAAGHCGSHNNLGNLLKAKGDLVGAETE